MSVAQRRAILAKLQQQAEGSDILTRHLAVEESLTDRPLTAGNSVTLLRSGEATYAAMFAAIDAARSSINLESYIFEDSDIGREFARRLIAKRRSGVSVNLIYDSVGSFSTPKAFFEDLASRGIRMIEYNPINPLSAKKAWLLNNRDHRKLLIVDGQTAFVGGINISSVYSSGSFARRAKTPPTATNSWRDTHMQINGPAAAEFQRLFAETWRQQTGEELPGDDNFPSLSARGQAVVRAISTSSAGDQYSMYLTLLSAVEFAEKSVHITTAYFVPDPQFLEAMADAAKRGAEVVLILPGHSDVWVTLHAGRSNYTHLLEAGVRIYEYQRQVLHSKTAVIDGVWSTVGSTNIDWRSFLHNEEANAVVLGNQFGEQMEAMFHADLENCRRIEQSEWAHRPFASRIQEWAAGLFEYWW